MATRPSNPLQRLGQGLRNLFGGRQRDLQEIKDTFSNAEWSNISTAPKRPKTRPGQTPITLPGRFGNKQLKPKPDPSASFGSIDAEGNITPPDVAGVADQALPDLTRAGQLETGKAEAALGGTRERVGDREARMEEDISSGVSGARTSSEEIQGIAQAGRAQVEGLPDRVKEDVQGIADQYRQQTDVDIGKIESLGREAVGMAMQGKNAAAEAAVQAQQASMQNAIATINADPNIPPSRKTAMIAQIKTQSSMQIASTVGANIKDFTALQTGAMTSTMQAVAGAMTARNQSLAALGGAEINAIASAHETAAGLMKGYDDMSAQAIQNADNLQFQYNTLRETSRAMNNETDLALLGEEFYVAGMPYDFKLADYQLLNDAMGKDFAMQLQAEGFENMQEAMQQGNAFAQQTMMWQALSQFLPGPAAMIGSMLTPMLFPQGGGMGGGK